MPRKNHRPRRSQARPLDEEPPTFTKTFDWNAAALDLIRRGLATPAILDFPSKPPGKSRWYEHTHNPKETHAIPR
jgi:hypothetical protein